MNTPAIRSTVLSTLGVALALASGPALAISFRLTDLGTLGGTFSQGVAINPSGQVTGDSTTASGETHAFLWDGTTMRDLGTLGGTFSTGVAINASGQVTGSSDTTDVPFEARHAFLWDGTTMRDLGAPEDLEPHYLNASGLAINASGQVTGIITHNEGDGFNAFLWDGAALQDLDTPDSIGFAINASGLVMGQAGSHTFLWDGTALQDLGTLGGTDSFGFALNASGQVTGYASTADEATHAFLWDGTTMQDLNALIDPVDLLQPFVTLGEGRDINDLGQILANGLDSRTGESHAYLVSPITGSVPEPGTLALLGLGLLGLGLTRRRAAN